MSELWRMREQPSRDTREGRPLQATKVRTAKAWGLWEDRKRRDCVVQSMGEG